LPAPEILPSATPSLVASPTVLPAAPQLTSTLEVQNKSLTPVQQQRLAEIARKYVAFDEPSAIQVARSLGYIKNDGHPASVCGPLSIAILRAAGLLNPYIDLHDFWLLNPRQAEVILERTFPRELYSWFQTSQPVNEFDFSQHPLQAGDFVYLFAGDPGSFEHMLTISRVDEAGRAYAVTNFDTPDGYVIEEVMLYDPSQPGIGKFYDWTDRRNAKLGLTGFGGFWVWRLQSPVADKTPLEQAFAAELDGILAAYGGVWRVYFREIGGRILYARQERHTTHPASVIKVPIAMLFFHALERQKIGSLQQALQEGIDGRTYAQLLEAMLVKSEEKATDSLVKALYQYRLDFMRTLQSWGASHTYIETPRQSTALEIAMMFEGMYTAELVDFEAREIILNHLSQYSPGDDLRLGVIRKYLPDGYRFYNKRGTITDELLVVADTAICQLPTSRGKRDFVLTILGYQGENKTTYGRLETAIGDVADLLGRYSREL
jgi:beta-lactamase class A